MKRWTVIVLLALSAASVHAADDPAVDELERKVEVLTQEIEAMKLGGAADTATSYLSRHGFGPGASKVYGISRGVSVGGYGEVVLQKFDRFREDDAPANLPPNLDALRAILYVGYKFNDELLFNSELEVEHAGVGGGADGEVVLEFAYMDWARRPEVGVRGGLLLIPVGLVNEMHEPPVFIGARRPEVEQRIIPSTWRGNGVGVFGSIGMVSYRTYITEGLDAQGFDATQPIRGGRQAGSESNVTHPAWTARVDVTPVPGVVAGVSGFTGDAWQQAQPTGMELEPRVTLFDVHARAVLGPVDARGLYTAGTLDDAGDLSDALGLVGDERLGEKFWGTYIEAAVDVMPWISPGSRYGLQPYARWETYDTQDDVPGGTENPANERTLITAGLAVRPHPNVVLKGERQNRSTEADTGTGQWNVQLGYLF